MVRGYVVTRGGDKASPLNVGNRKATLILGIVSQKQVKRRRREKREIQTRLAEQLRLLAKRCREFDNGDWGEAPDIATRLRVIFNPGGKSSPSRSPVVSDSSVPVLTPI
jgi:hypothetical protein